MSALDPAAASVHPIGLRLAGRRVVVVGGGRTAHRQVTGLLEAGASVAVVSPGVTPALEAVVATGAIDWVPRAYRAGDLDGAWFAVAATDDPCVNDAVARDSEAARVFCARTDDHTAGGAVTLAAGRSGDVVVAVHAGGDGRRAASVRDAVLDALTDGRVPVRTRTSPTTGVGLVTLVGGGPGDPALMTVRGLRALTEADIVVADHLAPQALLASLPPEVEVVDAAKLPRGRSMAQEQINKLLMEHALAGRRVVRLKGGDPFVFGRGMEEVEACRDAGVPVEVVPGISSAIGVPALAGIPVTHRGLTHEFIVVSGHLPPGHPDSLVDWPAIGRLRGTVVVLMGVATAAAIAAALIQHGRPPETPVAIVMEGTTARQRTIRTTLDNLGQALLDGHVRPPAVLLVGEVVGLHSRGATPRSTADPDARPATPS